MGWDGGGNVNLSIQWPSKTGTEILSTDMDTQHEDLVTAIEACINRNGENAVTADISWGSNKITSLADATAGADAMNARSVADNQQQYGGTTAGSSNTYTLTQDYIVSIGTGTRLLCLANHSNTGAATLNVNGGGAVAIVKRDGSTALDANDIISGDFFEVAYDGTSWVLIQSSKREVGITGSPVATDIAVYADDDTITEVDGLQATDNALFVGTDDTTAGVLHMYGSASAEGGTIYLYNAADQDTTYEYYHVNADTSGNFVIGVDESTDFVSVDQSGDWDFQAGNLTTTGTLGAGATSLSSLSLTTDLAVTHGGTGSSTAGGARTNLGLVIGTDVQAYDAELAALAGLTSAANKIPMFSGSGSATVIDFLDEDDMSSDSATGVPSQQSVKAYVDDNNAFVLLESGNLALATPTAYSTEIDFSTYNATYNAYKLVFSGLTVTVDSSNIDVQVSIDGGSSWKTTNEYDESGFRADGAAQAFFGNTNVSGIGIINSMGNDAAAAGAGVLYLWDVADTSRKFIMMGQCSYFDESNTAGMRTVGGRYDAGTDDITDIRLFASGTSQTIDGGTYALYGIKDV